MAVSDKAKKIICIVIGSVLIAAIIATVIIVSANLISPYKRNNLSFNSIKYSRPDLDGIENAFDQAFANVDGSYNAALNSVNSAVIGLNELVTAVSYVQVKYSEDYTDPYWSNEYNELYSAYNVYYNKYFNLLYEVLTSKNKDMLSSLSNEEIKQIERMHGAVDDEYLQAQNNITEITNEYNNLGTEITGSPSEADMQSFSTKAGDLLIELAQNYNVIAESEGYDNYADYAYESYGRSYDPQEAQALHSYVKTYLKNVVGELFNAVKDSDKSFMVGGDDPDLILDRSMNTIKSFLDEADDKQYVSGTDASMEGYLTEAYNYMDRYDQHIRSSNPKGNTGAYTTYLSGYDIPIMFQYMNGDIGDVSTFVHEFGHFTSYYMHGQYGGYDLDYAEVQSQGLELLFMNSYDELYKELFPYYSDAEIENLAKGLTRNNLMTTLIFSVQMGCIMDELQYDVYTNIDYYTSGEQVTAKFDELLDEYFPENVINGYSAKYDFKYWWAEVSHNFSQPFYYISYAVSAIPALTIYIDSVSDYSAALGEYHYIQRYGDGTYDFSRLLEKAGVDDPFSASTIQNIASVIREKWL